jgi:sialic acid synthase SpsE
MKIKELFNQFDTTKDHWKVQKPYIIAEAGVNHEGSIDLAKRLIDEAKEGGAHAIKFQTYKADTIASKNSPAYWDLNKESTTSQHALFTKYDKFWKSEYEELKLACDRVDIEFLSTPFDVTSADFLNDLMDVFKISSSDVTNRPFIEYMAKFGKPLIMSTGASELHEIQEAVQWIKPFKVQLALLHCVLNYPTPDENANLSMISGLKHHFPEYLIGYSDHTLPKDMKILENATLLGAKIIEKHFTHDKTLPGNDHYHAMDKEDLKMFFKRMKILFSVTGESEVGTLESEKPAIKNARRSLVATRVITAGEVIKPADLTWKRPAAGISPRFYYEIIGKKVLYTIKEDELLQWNKLS